MLKKVGMAARTELEALLGTRIFLEMFVKVDPGWRENPMKVRQLDWHVQMKALEENQAAEEEN
jgi:GTP-binding protein Era